MRRSSIVLLWASSLALVASFAPTRPCFGASRPSRHRLSSSSDGGQGVSSLVVISPPGGVGEVAAVQAANMGSQVRWFVVSSGKGSNSVAFSQQTLSNIKGAGGSVELAGADASSLLLSVEDPASAIQAVSTWCGAADSILCTFDGVDPDGRARANPEGDDPTSLWKNAIKIAAREGSSSIRGKKIAILSTAEELDVSSGEEEEGEGFGLGNLVGNLLGNKPSVPPSLVRAMMSSESDRSVMKLRHGQLFGMPESSPEFSALVGGPRKAPELCEEYTMRSVRVDPTLSVSGNLMMGSNTRSSRHTVGEAAALMALGKVSASKAAIDICVSSQRGMDETSLEEWQEEFERVNKIMSSSSVAAELFAASFASVPDVDRLADWLATKWAPAVLRTYDIASIRVGARPVYASRTDDGKVEIVWQQLVDFDSATVGRMLIDVSDNGLVATRGPGDASKGFGAISRKPLAGEDVLVRLLAEAYSQAIEKGLAKKPIPKKKDKPTPKDPPAEVAPVTSLQSSGTVTEEKVAVPPKQDQGPRQAGARRSTERKRGSRRREAPSSESTTVSKEAPAKSTKVATSSRKESPGKPKETPAPAKTNIAAADTSVSTAPTKKAAPKDSPPAPKVDKQKEKTPAKKEEPAVVAAATDAGSPAGDTTRQARPRSGSKGRGKKQNKQRRKGRKKAKN